MSFRFVCFSCLFCVGLGACGKAKPVVKNKVPLSHVTGKVLVDGEERQGVLIRYVPLSSIAESRPEYQVGIVNSEARGDFSLSTYEQKDGVPAGNYALSFSLLAKTDKGPGSKNRSELLAPKYTDLHNPCKTITVERGRDLDMGEIDLETQPIPMSKK